MGTAQPACLCSQERLLMRCCEWREYSFFCVKINQIASPGWMHETNAQGRCTRMTQRDRMGREVGGGFRMGNTCKSMADSYQCMAKTTTIL